MKKILVPFDFSKTAANALRFAFDIAFQSKGTIYLLHVCEQAYSESLRDKTNKNFDELISEYKVDVNFSKNVEFGPVDKMIHEFAIKNSMDLIVMGSHGASGLREILIGSNAEKVVRNSSIPVLVIKNHYKGPIKNIVFPNTLDLEKMEGLTMKVKALQAFYKAKIHIVYINTAENLAADTVTLARLKEFAKRFMFKDFTINVFNRQSEENGIIEFTKSIKGDLIAMGTHGRKGISHLINGSVAEDVVNHAESAIWTYNLNLEATPV